MSKIQANEIDRAWKLSQSPLMVQIIYKTGGSDTFCWWQLDRELTEGAYAKVYGMVAQQRWPKPRQN